MRIVMMEKQSPETGQLDEFDIKYRPLSLKFRPNTEHSTLRVLIPPGG